MKEEGPQLEALTRRLSECPSDFLAEPRTAKGGGQVEVAAVVFDLLGELGDKILTKKEDETTKTFCSETEGNNNEDELLGKRIAQPVKGFFFWFLG